jgi:outer membrane protein assembly factor BamB
VNGPWENEVLCIETDGKGSKIWRFAHTYSTAKNGFWSTPRGNVSSDGRFYMFTSDWQDQLGKEPDGKYRTDVFVVELR